MANLPAVQSPNSRLVAENIARLEAVCPSGFDFDAFATGIIVSLNEIKDECDGKSVMLAAFNLCQIGLIPGGLLGHAYLIPRRVKNTKRVCVEIGYQGYMHLSRESHWLDTVYAEIVLRGESFRHFVDRFGPQVEHEMPIDRVLSNSNVRQEGVGAYCVYRTRTGQMGLRVVPRSSIDAVDSHKDVWSSNYYEMVRKTAIRRAAKDWHLVGTKLAMALKLDEDHEIGREQRFVGVLTDAVRDVMRGQKSFSLHDLEDAEGECQESYDS